jgi:ABC-type nitrate/sulfonate/bicarbonate transport system permease component
LISGLKVAATYSISGAVVGEWIGAQSGLGYYLLRVKNGYALDKMFACVLVIVILSIAMNGVVLLSGRLAMPQSKKRKGEIQ